MTDAVRTVGDLFALACIVMIVIGTVRGRAGPAPTAPLALLAGIGGAALIAPIGAHLVVSLVANLVAVAAVAIWFWRVRRQRRADAETADDRRIATIALKGKNFQDVSISPDGTTAFVSELQSGTLSVVDLDRQVVTGVVKVGDRAVDVLALPDGRTVLVTVPTKADGGLAAVDVGTGRTTATVGGIDKANGMVLSPDRTAVHVISFGHDRIYRLDAATLAITGEAAAGGTPHALAASPDGAWIYVANVGTDRITVLDATTLRVRATVQCHEGPRHVALSPAGDRLYVACIGGYVTVMDTATLRIVETQRPSDYEGEVAAGDQVCYVTDPLRGRLLTLHGTRLTVEATVKFGKRAPLAIAPTGDGTLYVLCQTGYLDVIRP